uniref:Uncharacterized protein n=1 Tax=viral metagenome TaxID=1070528 RepID=A0A6C0JPX9_9ZZZZ
MKLNFPLIFVQDPQNQTDYEQQLRDFCIQNKFKSSFIWNHFSCGSTVLWINIYFMMRKKNNDGRFVKNDDGSFETKKYTIFSRMKYIPASVNIVTAKQLLSFDILKEICNTDFLNVPVPPIEVVCVCPSETVEKVNCELSDKKLIS